MVAAARWRHPRKPMEVPQTDKSWKQKKVPQQVPRRSLYGFHVRKHPTRKSLDLDPAVAKEEQLTSCTPSCNHRVGFWTPQTALTCQVEAQPKHIPLALSMCAVILVTQLHTSRRASPNNQYCPPAKDKLHVTRACIRRNGSAHNAKRMAAA